MSKERHFRKYQEQINLPLDKILTDVEAQKIIDENLVGYYKGRVHVKEGSPLKVEDVVNQLASLDKHIDNSVKKVLGE